MADFADIGIMIPKILLPGPTVDPAVWPVVACDQYTSEPSYWEQVAALVGERPSALRLVLPEVYLESARREEIIHDINNAMQHYLTAGILQEQPPGFVLVERTLPGGALRRGLVVALDLERYDYSDGSGSLIRATEGTIVDRLPPRVKVRKQALVETPHIMVLIDDPDRTVIEPLFQQERDELYDISLMMNSGRVRGYRVADDASLASTAAALAKLADRKVFDNKYGVSDKAVLVYAMGDGNHSLATAKVIWEELKQRAADRTAIMQHPARYALVELVNVHDPGLVFEPIHRVLFNVAPEPLFECMAGYFHNRGATFRPQPFPDLAAAQAAAATKRHNAHSIAYVAGPACGTITVENSPATIPVATLQPAIDDFLLEHTDAKIDYIHGAEVTAALGAKNGNMGFLLESIAKNDFFRTIIWDGSFPRKTFSMGKADEKRFYLECRKITP